MSETLTARTEEPVRSPADVYDEQFVPALFRHWGPVLCDAAAITSGQRVLDVACGTGALTVAVADRVSPGGAVLGLDANPEMLAVARRKHPDIEWHEGRAESLPFALCTDAEIAEASVVQRQGIVRFASIDALVSTERACVWTLGGLLDDAQFEQLRREAQNMFLPFVDVGGMVAFAMPALLISAAKR